MFSTARGFGGGGFMFVSLAPWDQRQRSQQEITADLNRRPGEDPGHPGLRLLAQQPRHQRRRPGTDIRRHRHRLRGDRRRRRQAARRDERGPDLRQRPAQLRHHPAAAFDQHRSRARRRSRHLDREHLADRPGAARRQGPRQFLHRRRPDRDPAAGAGGHDPGSLRPRPDPAAHVERQDGAARLAGDVQGNRGRPQPAARGPATGGADDRDARRGRRPPPGDEPPPGGRRHHASARHGHSLFGRGARARPGVIRRRCAPSSSRSSSCFWCSPRSSRASSVR